MRSSRSRGRRPPTVTRSLRYLAPVAALAAIVALSGCDLSFLKPQVVHITIDPTAVTLAPGGSHPFTATVTGTSDTTVRWVASCGTISGSGTYVSYTAPAVTGPCTVTVVSQVDSRASASAAVTVSAGGTPTLSLQPSSIVMTRNSADIVVANTGDTDSVLTFQASATSPYVSLSTGSGSVPGGSSQTIVATVASASLGPGTNLTMTVNVTSNGGNASTQLDYGIGTCGSYAPLGVSATASAAGPTVGSFATGPEPDAIPNEIIVGYRATGGSTGPQALRATGSAVRQAYGLQLLAGGTGGADLVRATDVSSALRKLRGDPRVRYAQPNVRVHALQAIPNDPLYPQQWHLSSEFGMPQAWAIETGASTRQVVVAVLDSGVQSDHEDLAAKLLPGWDFVDGDSDTNPGTGPTYNEAQQHGTHVAGIAAAIGNNSVGVAGVAYDPNVAILPVRVLDSQGNGDLYTVMNAIDWATGAAVTGTPTNAHPADVINMSLGVAGDQPAMDVTAANAWNAGTLLVAAAGNHGGTQPDDGVDSPANAPCVMAVGSVDYGYGLSYFSDVGPQLEVTAPGGFDGSNEILSTIPTGYGYMAGTSMASPFVAGVAALLKAQDPARSPAAIRDLIDGSTLRTGGMSDPSQYGYGVACADAALGASTVCGAPP